MLELMLRRVCQCVEVCCEARKRILEDVSSVKQGMQAANALSILLPAGGKTSKLRRNVSLLAESIATGPLDAQFLALYHVKPSSISRSV